MLYLQYGEYVYNQESHKEIAWKGYEDGSNTGT